MSDDDAAASGAAAHDRAADQRERIGVAIRAMAWLPAVLAGFYLLRAQSVVDVGLSLLVLPHAFLTLRLPALRRSRQLLIELPCILVGTLAIAALLVVSMASLLQSPVPWGQAVGFGGYMALWVLALRFVYQGIQWGVERLVRRPLPGRIVAAMLMIGLGMPQLFVALQTRRVAIGRQPDVLFARGGHREIAFRNDDGIELRGTLLVQEPAQTPCPIVVICHGLGSNRANYFGYAHMAWTQGCHALAFDFRGHGESEGVVTTIGAREVGDVVAACNWLRAQPEFAGCPIVLLGVSMGGASVLRAAAAANADAVFTESAYADLSSMLDDRMAGLGPLRHVAAWSVHFAAWLQLGVDLDAVSPRASLAALPASVPVTLVHAGDDQLISLDHGERLAAARPGLELHVIEGAAHGACLFVDWNQLERLLRRLLDRVRS